MTPTSTTLGILIAAVPGRQNFQYALTAQDAAWLARVVARRAQRQPGGDESAFIWRVLNRFATEARGSYPALHEFIRQRSPGITHVPWSALPGEVRRLVLLVVSGRVQSPSSQLTVRPAQGGWQQGGWQQGGWQQGGYLPDVGQTWVQGRPRYYQTTWRGRTYPRGGAWRRRRGVMYETAPTGNGSGGDSGGDTGGGGGGGQQPVGTTEPTNTNTGAPPDQNVDQGGDVGTDVADSDGGFQTPDGNTLVLTPDLLRSLITQFRRRRRRRGFVPFQAGFSPLQAGLQAGFQGGFQPGFQSGFQPGFQSGFPGGFQPGFRRGFRPGFGFGRRRFLPIASRIGTLARGARRIGTLRSRRTGARFPVFGGRVGRKNFRIVTRPRGGARFEIMTVRNGELEGELGT
jgi:hypothetical protein